MLPNPKKFSKLWQETDHLISLDDIPVCGNLTIERLTHFYSVFENNNSYFALFELSFRQILLEKSIKKDLPRVNVVILWLLNLEHFYLSVYWKIFELDCFNGNDSRPAIFCLSHL